MVLSLLRDGTKTSRGKSPTCAATAISRPSRPCCYYEVVRYSVAGSSRSHIIRPPSIIVYPAKGDTAIRVMVLYMKMLGVRWPLEFSLRPVGAMAMHASIIACLLFPTLSARDKVDCICRYAVCLLPGFHWRSLWWLSNPGWRHQLTRKVMLCGNKRCLKCKLMTIFSYVTIFM